MRTEQKHGFSLVEMLITMGIVVSLFVVFAQLAGGIFSLQLNSASQSSLTQDYRYLLSRLAYDVGRSATLTVPNSNTLDLTISGDTYRYVCTNNSIQLSINNSTPLLLNSNATSISSCQFSANDVLGNHESVSISARLTPTIMSPNQSSIDLDLSTTLGVRQ